MGHSKELKRLSKLKNTITTLNSNKQLKMWGNFQTKIQWEWLACATLNLPTINQTHSNSTPNALDMIKKECKKKGYTSNNNKH